ncbi:hypothetical protein evm_001779 [Chilo suppressalis]|nr:hypothetical protein evm_001779 [Chilo suppressalis]
MIFLLLFIITCNNIVKAEDDDQKYIDLLPESEKQAFLDIIARRLIKDVKYKNVDSAQSGEVPDDELDKHDEYVKDILREETDNMRREENRNKEKGEESLKVKGFDENKSVESFRNIAHIDLTLRNGERIRRNSAIETKVANTDKVPVQIVYDSNVKKSTKGSNFTSNEKNEESDNEDIQARGSRRQIRTHTVINDYEPEDETTEKHINEDSGKQVDNMEKSDISHSEELNKHYTASIYEPQETTQNATKLSTLSTIKESTTLTTTLMKNHTQNDTEAKRNRYLRSSGNESEKTEIIKSPPNNTLEKNTTFVENKDFYNNAVDPTKSNTSRIPKVVITTDSLLNKDKPVERRGAESATAISNFNTKIKNDSYKNENETPNPLIVIESAATTELPTITIHPGLARVSTIVHKAVSDLKTYNKSVPKEKKYATTEVNALKSFAKALRSGDRIEFEDEDGEGHNKSKEKVEELLHLPKLPKISKPYEVYEIPADQPPFIEKTKRKKGKIQRYSVNKEQPHYFPIYNYSPDQAYFNSYNRLGPNHDDINEDMHLKGNFEIETLHKNIKLKEKNKLIKSILRKFKFTQKRSEKGNKYIVRNSKPNKLKMPVVAKTPRFSEIYFNPNDYLDMDYYFGRSMRPLDGKSQQKVKFFPDSDDDDHVFNTIKTGQAKDLTRGTRQVLYGRHMFGHNMLSTTAAPLIESEEELTFKLLRSSNPGNYDMYMTDNKKYSIPDDDDIALDYYFGDQDENRLLKTENVLRHNSCSLRKGSKCDNSYESRIAKVEEVNKSGSDSDKKRGTIKEILAIDPTDAFLHLDELFKYNIPLARTREDSVTKEISKVDNHEINPFINVLRDMIDTENESLAQYDWLGSTVDIQSALEKLLISIKNLQKGQQLHPADVQLLKYIEYLFITSKSSFDQTHNLRVPKKGNQTKRKFSLLPRSKRRKREYFKAKGLLDRTWLYIRGRRPDKQRHKRKRLQELKQFLADIRSGLYDLHDAIRSVATVTNYKNQRWFQNLKQLYLKDSGKKQCLEVLLHLTVARMLDLVETAAKSGIEDNYELYIEQHEEEVMKTKEEFRLLLKVLYELNHAN